MTRRCEIIQWLSIFFGFAIHHNLQYYQYPQYWYDTNTNTIPIPIYIPIPLLLSVCEIVQRFTLALPFVTFQYCPSWSCQIHEDIWKIFGHRSVIGCFQPFGPPYHQLMYTYYQFVPPRCKWLYNDTAPHTANNTGNIRSNIRTIRTTYGKPYKRCGATYVSVEINAILPETRARIIPDQVSLPQLTISQFVQGVLIIESADKSTTAETLQIESKCLIVKFSSKLLDLSKGDMSCTVSVSHQLIKSKSQLNLNENHKILWNPDLTNWWNMFSNDNMLARAPSSVLSVHLWKFCNCNGQQFINLPAAHFLPTHPPALVDPAHSYQKHQNLK